MRQLLKDLCGLLKEQKDMLEGMLDMSQEKRLAIINGDTEQLEGIVSKEIREISKLKKIEKRRLEMYPAITAELGLAEAEITVTSISERVWPDEKKALQKLQIELTALVDEHKRLNEDNRQLVETHIEYTEAMMNVLVDSEDPLNNFYGEDGRETPDKKKATGFFDGRA